MHVFNTRLAGAESIWKRLGIPRERLLFYTGSRQRRRIVHCTARYAQYDIFSNGDYQPGPGGNVEEAAIFSAIYLSAEKGPAPPKSRKSEPIIMLKSVRAAWAMLQNP